MFICFVEVCMYKSGSGYGSVRVGLLVFCVVMVGCSQSEDPALKPPHIVFILADDMGYGDLGSFNPDSKIPTPNMDRIAAEGMRFTDAHSPSSVCTPTRYAFLTGRYAWRTSLKRGVTWGYDPLLVETDRVTIPSMLKAQGYTTVGVGKWHLGLGDQERLDYSQPLVPGPNAVGFDYYFGIPASLDMEPYVYFENERVVELPTDSVGPSGYEYGGPYWRAGPMAPGFRHIDVQPDITEKAVAQIEAHARERVDQPLFLYVPFASPHTPWLPTDEFRGTSEAGEYGDFVVMVDDAIGQIMAALDRTNMADETLLVVTSDNGSFWVQNDIERYNHLSNGTLRGMKADIWEGGHRVPFLVRWPGIVPANSTNDQTIAHTDMLATFAAVSGATLPTNAGEDSYNLLPALQDPALEAPIREATVHHSVSGVFAIRQGPWKLIFGRGSGGFTQPAVIEPGPGEPTGQLYNLETDPGETTNVYLDEPEVVARLQALLEHYQQDGASRSL